MKDDSVKKKLSIGLKILIGVLSLVLVVGVSVFGFVQSKLNKINEAQPIQEIVAPEDEFFEVEEKEVSMPEGEELNPDEIDLHIATDVMKDKNIVNILLIGQDRRAGEGRARSDAMILVTLNKKDNTIKLTSFMRDLYVELPGNYSGNRLNAAYQFGGMELLDETIKMNFGVEVEGNIEVDFEGFQRCVDRVGGIDLELNEVEVNYLNKTYPWQVQTGMNHLDGEKALAFSRIRYVGNADYERTQRQRRVLTEVFKKVKQADIGTILGLVDEMFPLLTTDISKMDILGYATIGLKISDIENYRIPIDGGFTSGRVRGMQVLVPNLEKNRQHLQETLYGKME